MTRWDEGKDGVRGHEGNDANALAIVLTAAGLLVTVVILAGLVGLMVRGFMGRGPSPDQFSAMIEERRPPSSPGPLDDMPAIRRRLEAEQRRNIETTGWVDRGRGIAHIPIEEAMREIAERGLPRFGPGETTPADQADGGGDGEGKAQ